MKTPQELELEEQDKDSAVIKIEDCIEDIHQIIEKAVRNAIKTGDLSSKGGEFVYKQQEIENEECAPLSNTELEIIFAYFKFVARNPASA